MTNREPSGPSATTWQTELADNGVVGYVTTDDGISV
jgi:hypothetical protein